jgi:hypothetical protein
VSEMETLCEISATPVEDTPHLDTTDFPLDGQQQKEILNALIERCKESKLPVQMQTDQAEDRIARVTFPNGKQARWVYLSWMRVRGVLALSLEKITYLGDYDALYDRSNGVIVAGLAASRETLAKVNTLNFPNLEIITQDSFDVLDDEGNPSEFPILEGPTRWALASEIASHAKMTPSTWRIQLPGVGGFSALLLRGNHTYRDLIDSNDAVIIISGLGSDVRHDNAVHFLESVSSAILFNMDLKSNLSMSLKRLKSVVTEGPLTESVATPMKFPSLIYPQEAVSFYQYGRSATQHPLIEFLAYYQVMEIFFPFFARKALIEQVKTFVRDPRFNPEDDRSVGRIVEISSTSKATGSEREQLRSLFHSVCDSGFLYGLITRNEAIKSYFCGKQQMSGIAKISINENAPDLRDQFADRIYDIRCRVVHTKDRGRDAEIEILHPGSVDLEALRIEIPVARVVAQKVIVSRAVSTSGADLLKNTD